MNSFLHNKPTWKISNPAISRMPMNEAPCLCLRSRALLILWTSHLNRRSYVALAKASTAKSAWKKQFAPFDTNAHCIRMYVNVNNF